MKMMKLLFIAIVGVIHFAQPFVIIEVSQTIEEIRASGYIEIDTKG